MSSKGISEDVSTLLYLVPFIASGVYGIYLWARNGITTLLPSSVYLTVTRDPYLFIIGSFAIMFGMIIEVTSGEQKNRQAEVKSAAGSLQWVAGASFVFALIGAWYSNGFVNILGALTDFIVGRYSVIFPTVAILLSYLVTMRVKIEALQNPKVLGVIAMLLVPPVVYEIGKRDTAGGLAIALVLVIVGIVLFVKSSEKTADSKQQ